MAITSGEKSRCGHTEVECKEVVEGDREAAVPAAADVHDVWAKGGRGREGSLRAQGHPPHPGPDQPPPPQYE